jgi:hypothetical protein
VGPGVRLEEAIMAGQRHELLGGPTIYDVNLTRVQRANELVYDDPDTGPRLRAHLERIEGDLDEMERAAMALVVIDRLIREI